MRRLRLALLAALALTMASCECLDETGHIYSCTCQRRCQGVTSTYSTTSSCTTGGATTGAQSRCISSCSPEASCTSCSCTQGPECTIAHNCR